MQLFLKKKKTIDVNIDELSCLKRGHLLDTRILVAKIYTFLPQEIKSDINMSDLQEAAMLHDYGKVLIPIKILSKEGNLSSQEREIMELHSEIGYELLKQQGVRESVLNLVRYHHQNPDGTGYPAVTENFTYTVSMQILKVADEYSAMREDRCYRKSATKKEALDIIKNDVEKGYIIKEVYDALCRAVI